MRIIFAQFQFFFPFGRNERGNEFFFAEAVMNLCEKKAAAERVPCVNIFIPASSSNIIRSIHKF